MLKCSTGVPTVAEVQLLFQLAIKCRCGLPANARRMSVLVVVRLIFCWPCLFSFFLLPWASLVVRTLHPLGSMRAPRCPSRFTTLQVGFGGMCVYTLRQKGIRREYCGVRGANVEEVGATDIEETKLPTPVLRIYEVSVVPCPQLRPTIVACSASHAAPSN